MNWGMNRGSRRGAGLRLALAGASLLALVSAGRAMAADADAPISAAAAEAPAAVLGAQAAAPAAADAAQTTPAAKAQDNPYAKLGSNPLMRLWNYEVLELGKSSAPVDPTAPPAPPSVRDGWTPPPQTTAPMPFTDWPYGGTTTLGDNRTASVDSPLMVALANTSLGKAMQSAGIQMYGWVDYGGNISSSKQKFGNAPAAYDYNPNNIQLDQAVLYVERTPDTVQTDHIDWGFRVSAIYGENYRYTTAYGIASYQLLKDNKFLGYDFPMVYGEVYIPQVAQGMMIRVGRYISVPDIEAQLAPNNYMYSHSIGYSFDNYTNEGIQTTIAITKQFMLQLGVNAGTEAAVWHSGQSVNNLFPNSAANLAQINNYLTANNLPTVTNANPLYPNSTFRKDPGATPSGTVCARYQTKSGNDDLNLCADAINNGQWGYNNLQWYGFTYYHKFNQHWHVSAEVYNEHQSGVPNENNQVVQYIYQNGGTPFSPQFIKYNAPDLAQCKDRSAYRCTADAQAAFAYWNYSPNALNNISLRTEYYDDKQGQRTGYAAVYYDVALGWQHWLSPQIELRPEIAWYHASKDAFDLGTKDSETIFSGDAIVHF
jgi:hypothetical protein